MRYGGQEARLCGVRCKRTFRHRMQARGPLNDTLLELILARFNLNKRGEPVQIDGMYELARCNEQVEVDDGRDVLALSDRSHAVKQQNKSQVRGQERQPCAVEAPLLHRHP